MARNNDVHRRLYISYMAERMMYIDDYTSGTWPETMMYIDGYTSGTWLERMMYTGGCTLLNI